MVMALTANGISGRVDMHKKFTDPRMARKVSCTCGYKATLSWSDATSPSP
jgi:hypothetical protein